MVENKWRGIAILLMIFVAILGLIMYGDYKDPTYDFGEGFEMKSSELNEIADNFEYGETFRLCRTEGNESKCIIVGRLSK